MAVFIPLLDCFISELKSRFETHKSIIVKRFDVLIPKNAATASNGSGAEALVSSSEQTRVRAKGPTALLGEVQSCYFSKYLQLVETSCNFTSDNIY